MAICLCVVLKMKLSDMHKKESIGNRNLRIQIFDDIDFKNLNKECRRNIEFKKIKIIQVFVKENWISSIAELNQWENNKA